MTENNFPIFMILGHCMTLNVVVEWLALLLRIREVPGSYQNPETGYPDRFVIIFLNPFRKIPG
jgi:hypothetical protein